LSAIRDEAKPSLLASTEHSVAKQDTRFGSNLFKAKDSHQVANYRETDLLRNSHRKVNLLL